MGPFFIFLGLLLLVHMGSVCRLDIRFIMYSLCCVCMHSCRQVSEHTEPKNPSTYIYAIMSQQYGLCFGNCF